MGRADKMNEVVKHLLVTKDTTIRKNDGSYRQGPA